MPAGTYADPYILDGSVGAHSIAVAWHGEEIFGVGYGFYPIFYCKVETAADLVGIRAQALAGNHHEIAIYYQRVDDPSDPSRNSFTSWSNGAEFVELVWAGTPLYLVFMDYSQDYGESPIGPFTFSYEIVAALQEPLPPADRAGSVTESTPVQLCTREALGGANLYVAPIELDRGVIVVYGGMTSARAAVVDVTTDPPTVLDEVEYYQTSFVGGGLPYKVSNNKVVKYVSDQSAGSPYPGKWVQITTDGQSISVTDATVTPTAVQNVNQWFPFNDGTDRVLTTSGSGLRIIRADADGVLLEAGSYLSVPPGVTGYFYYSAYPVPGDPTHCWVTWRDTAKQAYVVTRAAISGMTVTNNSDPYEVPTQTPPVLGGNWGGLIVVSPDLVIAPYGGTDPNLGYAPAWNSDEITIFDVYAVSPSGALSLVDRRQVDAINHEGWVSPYYQDAQVAGDRSSYGDVMEVFAGQVFTWGSHEAIQPDPGDYANWEWAPAEWQMLTFTADTAGMRTSLLTPSTVGISRGSLVTPSCLVIADFGITAPDGLRLRTFRVGVPNLTGLMRANRTSFDP